VSPSYTFITYPSVTGGINGIVFFMSNFGGGGGNDFLFKLDSSSSESYKSVGGVEVGGGGTASTVEYNLGKQNNIRLIMVGLLAILLLFSLSIFF
jgi:hypothetical protein